MLLRFLPKAEKSARPLREGLDLEIGVLGGDGAGDPRPVRYFGIGLWGCAKNAPAGADNAVTPQAYVARGHVVASRRGLLSGPVDDGLAEHGLTRNIAAVVPGFPAALAVARSSDLVALIPASFLISPATEDIFHVFELPVKTHRITVSQLWHPRSEVDPAQRWLRQFVRAVCQRLMPE